MNVRVSTNRTTLATGAILVEQWAYLGEDLQCKITFRYHDAPRDFPLHDGMSVRELLKAMWSMGMDVGYEYANIWNLEIPGIETDGIGESYISFD